MLVELLLLVGVQRKKSEGEGQAMSGRLETLSTFLLPRNCSTHLVSGQQEYENIACRL